MGLLGYIIYASVPATLCLAAVIAYRLLIHPLARVPGPKFAAISTFYEWYSDCVQPGTYVWKIRKWHEQYGPIVRIGPDEVHINDPEWYDVLYSSSAKYDKDPWFYGLMGNHDSGFTTVEHELHRIKRHKQNPFFSRQNVDKAAPIITEVLNTMLNRFEAYRNTGNPLAIKNALRSFATDIICEFCFPDSMGFSKSSDFAKTYHSGQENFQRMFPWFRHTPGLATLMTSAPDWMTPYMDQPTQAAISFIKFIEAQVKKSVEQSEAKESDTKRSIIRDMYESDMPPEYRTPQSLEHEAATLVGAGSSTVARTVEASLFYILQDPTVVSKLTEEIRSFKPDDKGILTQRELEGLPYLSAVVLECQRRYPVIPSRLPRINRTQDMTYGNYLLPKGTVIGMALWDVLLDEQLWENPYEFQPSRWLDSVYKTKMMKYMVPFGRGTRNCVGQNLAMAELYMLLGNFFRRFDAELFETDEAEVKIVQDCFEALPYKGSVGVRLLLK